MALGFLIKAPGKVKLLHRAHVCARLLCGVYMTIVLMDCKNFFPKNTLLKYLDSMKHINNKCKPKCIKCKLNQF